MNEYTSKGGVARSHSDNGNLKDDGKHTFVFDYKNRLIGAFDKATNNPVAAYLYYCDNRRAKKIVYSQTSPGVIERQERFFYDGQQVVEETDDAGNTLLTWVYSPVYVDEPVQYVRSASHSLGAGTFYLHQNARADVVAVTDAAGAVVERRLYDDYGRSFDGTSKAPVSGSTVGNVYGFQGRRLDAETGLYYFRARYYDPSTGRFVQRDPVWDPGNFGNQYSFVGNGPVSKGDPEGEQGPSAIDHYTSKKYSGDKATHREAMVDTLRRITPRYAPKIPGPITMLATEVGLLGATAGVGTLGALAADVVRLRRAAKLAAAAEKARSIEAAKRVTGLTTVAASSWKHGRLIVERGAKFANKSEAEAVRHFLLTGRNVRLLMEAGRKGKEGVKTADLVVQGLGRVDVYAPLFNAARGTYNLGTIVGKIGRKRKQAETVFVHLTHRFSPAQMEQILRRVWSSPKCVGISRVIFSQAGKTTTRVRPRKR